MNPQSVTTNLCSFLFVKVPVKFLLAQCFGFTALNITVVVHSHYHLKAFSEKPQKPTVFHATVTAQH